MAPLRRWLSSHAKDRDDRACPAEDKSAPSDHKPVPLDDPVRLLDDMSKEYYAIVEVVSGFDQRLMTIKGWSVTLSLAALGLGFQQGHYALFALAAATAGGFWYVDPLNKGFQTRYYGRMRDIEVAAHALNHVNIALKRKPETSPETYPGVPPKSWEFWTKPHWLVDEREPANIPMSAPRIDWSWAFNGDPAYGEWRNDPPIRRTQEEIRLSLRRARVLPNVAFPHVVAVILGILLFAAALIIDLIGFRQLNF